MLLLGEECDLCHRASPSEALPGTCSGSGVQAPGVNPLCNEEMHQKLCPSWLWRRAPSGHPCHLGGHPGCCTGFRGASGSALVFDPSEQRPQAHSQAPLSPEATDGSSPVCIHHKAPPPPSSPLSHHRKERGAKRSQGF